MNYQTQIEWSDEDEAYIGRVPALRGCVAHGDTYAEAAANLQEAMELWLESAGKHGDEIPASDLPEVAIDYTTAQAVRFDPDRGFLILTFSGVEQGIPIQAIPKSDWDSTAPIRGFALSKDGKVVICSHADGEETPFAASMWEPGGFTPTA